MIARAHLTALVLLIGAGLWAVIGTFWFASLSPGYSHVARTISELGQSGAPRAHEVAFGLFLPVGVLVWVALWLVHREASDRNAPLMLLAFSCLGTGYVVAAFFPCDPGSPLFGSWRQQMHNAFGFIEYAGVGTGFLLLSRHLARRKFTVHATLFGLAGILMLLCLALLCSEDAFRYRGAVQRVAEVILFIGVACACLVLPRTEVPNRRSSEPEPAG